MYVVLKVAFLFSLSLSLSQRLTRHGLLEQITASVETGTYTIGSSILQLINLYYLLSFLCSDHLQAPEIRHFLYRSRKSLSVTSPQLPALYSQEEDQLRLATRLLGQASFSLAPPI